MAMMVRCARCDQPVEELTVEIDECGKTYTVTAKCHGETDTCTLTTTFIEACQGRLEEDLTFTGDRA